MDHTTVGENNASEGVQDDYDEHYDSDELDEELEVMLYCHAHYKCDDTMDQGLDKTECSLTASGTELVVTVNDLDSSPKKTHESKLSAGQHSQLFENTPFDGEDLTEEYQVIGENSFVDKKSESSIPRVISSGACEYQTPEIIFGSKTTVDSYETRKRKTPKFDLEAELGIDVFPNRKISKTVLRKREVSTNKTFSTPKMSEAKPQPLTSDFITINGQISPPGRDFRKKENSGGLLTNRAHTKKVQDTIVINSDAASSISPDSDSSDSESVFHSSSDSDIELLDNITHDHSAGSSAVKPTLDLNWNVSFDDQQTIQRVEESKWKISDADLKRSQSSRYFNNTKKDIRCHNCNKEGHLSKVCPEPKKRPNCGLCGEEGHSLNRCKNQLCFNCHQAGHRGAKCPLPKRDRFAKCPRCQRKGHTEDQCPDQWRQYHMTTTAAKDLVPRLKKVNERVYCCNCAKKGHFAFECREERMAKFVFPSSPFVVKYDVEGYTREPPHSRGRHKRSADTDGEPQTKRLKSSHHQGNTPHQSLYPRGPRDSVRVNGSHSQRYFNNKHPTHHQHKSSHHFSHKSQPTDNRTLYAGFLHKDSQEGLGQKLTPFAKKMLEPSLMPGPSQKTWKQKKQNKDWKEQDDFHHQHKSHKRQSGPVERKDPENPSAHKKKRKRRHKKDQERTGGSSTYNFPNTKGKAVMGRQHQAKNQQKNFSRLQQQAYKQKISTKLAGTSSKGRESLVVTCANGFRTTKKTVIFHRNSRNKQ